MTGSAGRTGSHCFWSNSGLFHERLLHWPTVTAPLHKADPPPPLPSFQTGLTSPTPPDLSQNILLFLSLCHYTFSCLHPIFPGTPVLEFLSSLTGLLLGPVWVGWAGWTQGVLGTDRATTLPPLGPALLTQRRASWSLRITGGRWVIWCTRLILFIILFTYELLYCI